MGCASSRSCLEETTIQAQSIKTGFEVHTTEAVVRSIRAHSTAKFIIPAHFNAIKKELSLNDWPENQQLLKAFYARISSTEESDRSQLLAAYPRLSQAELGDGALIREEELTVLAILLSRSPAKEKAVALFNVFDDGLGGNLTEPAINELFKVAFELALSHLPKLYKKPTEEVDKYLEKAQQNYTKAIAAAVALVVTDKKAPAVALKTFVKAVGKQKKADLTSATGLREYAVNQTPKEAKPADKDKAKKSKAKESKEGEKPADAPNAPVEAPNAPVEASKAPAEAPKEEAKQE